MEFWPRIFHVCPIFRTSWRLESRLAAIYSPFPTQPFSPASPQSGVAQEFCFYCSDFSFHPTFLLGHYQHCDYGDAWPIVGKERPDLVRPSQIRWYLAEVSCLLSCQNSTNGSWNNAALNEILHHWRTFVGTWGSKIPFQNPLNHCETGLVFARLEIGDGATGKMVQQGRSNLW